MLILIIDGFINSYRRLQRKQILMWTKLGDRSPADCAHEQPIATAHNFMEG